MTKLKSDKLHVYLGSICDFKDNPFFEKNNKLDSLYWEPCGAIIVDEKGKIVERGKRHEILAKFPNCQITDYSDALILPGFIDTHLHMPQLDIIGSYGESLLTWLRRYTFPAESRFVCEKLSYETSSRLIEELLANGITTSVMFAAVYKQSAQALFQAAQQKGIRAVIGKVSMDQHAPSELLVDAQQDYEDSLELINKWHRCNDRLFYALTPRFAPTCSMTMLKTLSKLKEEVADLYIQTHLGETRDEIKWVKELFPKSSDYFSIYDSFGLSGAKSIFAHGIYLELNEIRQLKISQSKISHCPTSNLFLGSGFCPVKKLIKEGISVSLGSDIGGGTSLSMWQTLGAAYKVSVWLQEPLHPVELLYLSTVSGAKALNWESKVGSLAPGFEADFQVINPRKNRLLAKRFSKSLENWPEHLLATIMLGDDRLNIATYVKGKNVFINDH